MSLVIGIVNGDHVVIACDSQITLNGVRKVSKEQENYKIWHPDEKKEILFANTGTVREMNCVKSIPDLVDEVDYLKGEINQVTLTQKVVKKMITNLKDDFVIESKDNVLTLNNSYLFAYKNKLYQILSSGAVIRIDEYTAIGSGANEALASLRNSEGKEVIERIRLAMDASSNNDIYVDYPLIVGTTDTLKFEVMETRIIEIKE